MTKLGGAEKAASRAYNARAREMQDFSSIFVVYSAEITNILKVLRRNYVNLNQLQSTLP